MTARHIPPATSRATALLLPLIVAGCVVVNVGGPGHGLTRPPATCNAADYRAFVGQRATRVALPPNLRTRVLGPQSVATTDFQPDRLNVFVDSFGVVQRFSCG